MNTQRYSVQPMVRSFNGLTAAGEALHQKFEERRKEMGESHLTHPSKRVQRLQPSPGPAAWAVPRLLPGDVTEGNTVTWDLTFDATKAHSVTDRFGKTFKPRALVYEDEQPKNR